jgi:DNA-directed RNA polymerase specialized sigma24 family protein
MLEAAETRAALRVAVGRLSAAEQQVVLLYYMGERSQAAIAEFLNVAPNVVKTRLYAARKTAESTHDGDRKWPGRGAAVSRSGVRR